MRAPSGSIENVSQISIDVMPPLLCRNIFFQRWDAISLSPQPDICLAEDERLAERTGEHVVGETHLYPAGGIEGGKLRFGERHVQCADIDRKSTSLNSSH